MTLPIPGSLPSSGCPAPVWPSNGQETNYEGTGYLDVLNQYMQYMFYHPTDPNGIMNFMQYLVVLQQHGVLNNPDVQNMLSTSNSMNEISNMVTEASLWVLFNGYNGSNGQTGITNWLNQMNTVLGGLNSTNPYITAMQSAVQTQIIAIPAIVQKFGFSNGGTGSVQIGNVLYEWSNPSDRYFIDQYIANISANGDPNPYYSNLDINAVNRAYRVASFNAIIAQFPNDPSIILCLWIMEINDTSAQAQQGGLADTTNLMNYMTNTYATPLLESAQQCGSMTDAQSQQFVQLFYNSTNLMNMEGQLSSIAPTWNSNVADTVTNMQVTFTNAAGDSITASLGQVMTGAKVNGYTFTPGDVTLALNSLNQTPTSGTASGTNAGYQTLVNALQQGGALLTNTTQTLVTKLGTVSQIDNQYLKFGGAVTSSTGGGFMQMLLQIVNNQKST